MQLCRRPELFTAYPMNAFGPIIRILDATNILGHSDMSSSLTRNAILAVIQCKVILAGCSMALALYLEPVPGDLKFWQSGAAIPGYRRTRCNEFGLVTEDVLVGLEAKEVVVIQENNHFGPMVDSQHAPPPTRNCGPWEGGRLSGEER